MHFRKNKTVIRKPEKENLESAKDTVNKENGTSGCSHAYGYLAVRPKNSSIPQECLCCLRVINCLYNTKKIKNKSS